MSDFGKSNNANVNQYQSWQTLAPTVTVKQYTTYTSKSLSNALQMMTLLHWHSNPW